MSDEKTTIPPEHPWPGGTLVGYGRAKFATETYYAASDDGPEAYDLVLPGTVLNMMDGVPVKRLRWLKGPGELTLPTAKEVLQHIGASALGGWGDEHVRFDTFDPNELEEDHRGVLQGTGPDGQAIWVEFAVTRIVEMDL